MELRTFRFAAITFLLTSCGNGNTAASSATASVAAASSAKPQPSATSSASAMQGPAPSSSASAAAADAPDPCKKHNLKDGAGTKADMCKYENDVLMADYFGPVDDTGAVFAIMNPWPDEVTWLRAAVFYYDKDGKQLTIKVGDKDQTNDMLDGIAVKIPGSKTTNVPLGLAKKDLPAEVNTIELQIAAFGWDASGDTKAAYFTSTTPISRYRGIHGGDGPTGIAECDQYREKLQTCPKQFPDALTAMRTSLRQYNNAAPETQKTLAAALTATCSKGLAAIADRCHSSD